MKASWLVAALLALLLSPGAARADMGMTGFKRLEARLVIDNFDDYPEHHFFWIDPKELTQGTRPADGLPRVMPELIRYRGGHRFKLKGE